MQRRIKIREYQNCINIEVKARLQPVRTAVSFMAIAVWAGLFFTASQYALLLPWALVQAGLIYYVLWLFLEKTTVAVFPEYILVAKNYFFLEITGRFLQRDAVTGLRKSGDNSRIIFEYLGRPETLIGGLNPEEAAFIMKFLVFSLGSAEFCRPKDSRK